MFVSLQLVSFVCCFLPLVSTIHPLVTSFLSFQFLPSVCCQVVHFDTSVRTFHLSVSICYFFPFALPLTVRLLLELFRWNSFLSFVTSLCSFQHFPSIRQFLSFQLFPFIRYCLPFVSTLSFHSLLLSFRVNSLLSFVTSILSFQLSAFIRYFLPFVSTLCFHSFLPSVCFNSCILFVSSSLRFKSLISLRLSLRFTTLINPSCSFLPVVLPLTVRLLLEHLRCNSFLSFVTSFL